MFLRAFKYKFIRNIRNRQNFFWTIAFPIILATFFSMSFGSLGALETLDSIKVAIVDENNSNPEFVKTFEDLNLFTTKKTTKEKANNLMKDGEVEAIINIEGSDIKMSVKENGMSETIVKSVVDSISQTTSTVTNIFMVNPNGDIENITKMIQEPQSFTQRAASASKNNDPYSIFFFALIAMTCLFASMTSLYSVNDIQGNQSEVGARQNISPNKKILIFAANISADMVSQCFGITILLIYIKYILKYNIGNFSIWLLLVCYISIFACICLGTLIASALKANIMIKSALLTAVSLSSCGLAGLFSNEVKVVVERKISFIEYVNPASIISDGLISLYYFNSMQMYFVRLAILSIAGIVMFALSCLILRRQKYECI